VTTAEVGNRLRYALWPIGVKFSEIIEKNPDVYGPFWLMCSLVFILTFSGNFSNYLLNDVKL
jgi:hypothetical protein